MIQFYDDRPSDPLEAFIYFEDIFRKRFLIDPLTEEKMKNYMMYLLVAKRDLKLSIIPKWETLAINVEEFDKEILDHFHVEFDKKIFLRFESEVLSIVEKLKGERPGL
jgi:hypothetical protein